MAGVFVAAAPAREWECKLFQAHAELLAWRGQVGEPETAPTDTLHQERLLLRDRKGLEHQQEAQRPISDLITNYMVGLSSGITSPLNPSKLKEAENDLLPNNGQFFGLSTLCLFLNLPQNMGIGFSKHFLTTQI